MSEKIYRNSERKLICDTVDVIHNIQLDKHYLYVKMIYTLDIYDKT
jgi:hypothetical protein